MAGMYRRMIQTVDSHTEGNSTRVITGGYPDPARPHAARASRLALAPRRRPAPHAELRAARPRHDVLGPADAAGRRARRFLRHHHGAGRVRADVRPLHDRHRDDRGRDRHGGGQRAADHGRDRDAGRPGALRGGSAGRPGRRRELHERRIVPAAPRRRGRGGRLGRGSARHRLWRRLLCDRRCRPAGAAAGARQRRGADRGGAAHHPRGEPAARHPPSRAAGHQSLLSDPLHLGRDRHGRSQADHRLPAGLARSQPLRHRHLGARGGAATRAASCALHQPMRFEGVLGTCFTGEAVAAQERAGVLYVTPKVTGRAWITGFHQFVLDPEDPLPGGFRIGHPPRPAPDPEHWS